MSGYVIVSVVGGILFGILDGVINANSLAQRLYAVYKPIARTSINPLAGIAIDLVYGFIGAHVCKNLRRTRTRDRIRRILCRVQIQNAHVVSKKTGKLNDVSHSTRYSASTTRLSMSSTTPCMGMAAAMP